VNFYFYFNVVIYNVSLVLLLSSIANLTFGFYLLRIVRPTSKSQDRLQLLLVENNESEYDGGTNWKNRLMHELVKDRRKGSLMQKWQRL
jgi:hypothetical protein